VVGNRALFAQCNPPTDLQAAANGANLVLTWNAVPNALSYNIYRQDSIIANGVATNSFTTSGMSADWHCFTVRTVCSTGVSENSNQACASKGACDAPSGLTATVNGNDISLSWTGTSTAVSYNIYCNSVLVMCNVNSTSFTFENLSSGEHCYTVTSVCDDSNESDYSNEACGTINAPCDAPANVEAVVFDNINVRLSWSPSSSAVSYNIYREDSLIEENVFLFLLSIMTCLQVIFATKSLRIVCKVVNRVFQTTHALP
jgi:hypothetical protein